MQQPTTKDAAAWVAQYWRQIAATAWRGFRTYGRGAVVAYPCRGQHGEIHFAPLNQQRDGLPVLDEAVVRRCEEYDPLRQVVVFWLHESTRTPIAVTAAADPPPPDAAQTIAMVPRLEGPRGEVLILN